MPKRRPPVTKTRQNGSRSHGIAQRSQRQADTKDPAARPPGRQPATDTGGDQQRQRKRDHGHARNGRGVAKRVLQIKRQQGHQNLGRRGIARHGNSRPDETAVAEQRNLEHGPRMDPLRQNEANEQGSTNTKFQKRGHAAPAIRIGIDQGPNDPEQPGTEQQDPWDVEPPSLRITGFVHRCDGKSNQRRTERQVDQERPTPPQRRGHEARPRPVPTMAPIP